MSIRNGAFHSVPGCLPLIDTSAMNKRDRNFDLPIPGATGGQLECVDVTTGFQPPFSTKLTSDNVTLRSFSVAVLTVP